MIQRNRSDKDVRAESCLWKGIETTGVRDFGFCEQRESPVLQSRKRLWEEECGSQDQKVALWLILNETWKSKIEIPANVS